MVQRRRCRSINLNNQTKIHLAPSGNLNPMNPIVFHATDDSSFFITEVGQMESVGNSERINADRLDAIQRALNFDPQLSIELAAAIERQKVDWTPGGVP